MAIQVTTSRPNLNVLIQSSQQSSRQETGGCPEGTWCGHRTVKEEEECGALRAGFGVSGSGFETALSWGRC